MKNILELAPIVFVCSLIVIVPLSVAISCGEQSTKHSIFTYVIFNTKDAALHF
jgi:hypothetical protein